MGRGVRADTMSDPGLTTVTHEVSLEGWGLRLPGVPPFKNPNTPLPFPVRANIAEAMSCLKKSRGIWGQSPQRHHEGGEAAANYPRAATGLEAPGPTRRKCPRNSRSKIDRRLKFAPNFRAPGPEIARNYRSKCPETPVP
jgi:hypothetical protein